MSNLVTVYAPNGDTVEVTPINAHDLTTHAGFTWNPPGVVPEVEGVKPAPVPTPAPKPAPAPAPVVVEDEEDAEDDDAEDETAEEADEVFTTVEQFDALETRDDVVAYLAKHFKDFKPHHLTKREKLIDKAIELAAK